MKAKGDEELRIRDIFTSHLPGTMKKNGFRLSVHPHVGDFDNRDNLRVSLGMRYGLTQRWEIGVGTDSYFSHGFGEGKFMDRYGIANIMAGSKWNIGQSLLRGWDSAIGIDYLTPVDHPPIDLTDGLRHVSVYVSFSRRLKEHPQVRIFWSLAADEASRTSIPGELRKNDQGDSSNAATIGAVLDRGRLHYTIETTVATTRLLCDTRRDSFVLRPGVLWEIPSRKGGKEKGNWMLGGSVKAVEGPDGLSFGASLKLRLNFNLKRLFHRE